MTHTADKGDRKRERERERDKEKGKERERRDMVTKIVAGSNTLISYCCAQK